MCKQLVSPELRSADRKGRCWEREAAALGRGGTCCLPSDRQGQRSVWGSMSCHNVRNPRGAPSLTWAKRTTAHPRASLSQLPLLSHSSSHLLLLAVNFPSLLSKTKNIPFFFKSKNPIPSYRYIQFPTVTNLPCLTCLHPRTAWNALSTFHFVLSGFLLERLKGITSSIKFLGHLSKDFCTARSGQLCNMLLIQQLRWGPRPDYQIKQHKSH